MPYKTAVKHIEKEDDDLLNEGEAMRKSEQKMVQVLIKNNQTANQVT